MRILALRRRKCLGALLSRLNVAAILPESQDTIRVISRVRTVNIQPTVDRRNHIPPAGSSLVREMCKAAGVEYLTNVALASYRMEAMNRGLDAELSAMVRIAYLIVHAMLQDVRARGALPRYC